MLLQYKEVTVNKIFAIVVLGILAALAVALPQEVAAQDPQASDPTERTHTLGTYDPLEEAFVRLPSVSNLPAVTLRPSDSGGTHVQIDFGVCSFSNSTWYGPTFNASGEVTGTGALPRFNSDGSENPNGSYWRLVARGAHGPNTKVLVLEGKRSITVPGRSGESITYEDTPCFARISVNFNIDNPPPTFASRTTVPETRPGATVGTRCYVVETPGTAVRGTSTASQLPATRSVSACMTAAEFRQYRGIENVTSLPTCASTTTGVCRQ